MSLPVERGVEIQAGVRHTRRAPWELPASTPDGGEVWLGLDKKGMDECIGLERNFSRDFRRVFDPPKA